MISTNQSGHSGWRTASPLEFGAAALLMLAALAILGTVLVRSHYGIDLTDEGFYLNWIANPSSYAASVTQFGFMYHPLYKMAHGDVALIRQANYLVTFGLAWILSMAVFYRVFAKRVPTLADILPLAGLSAAVASASFLVVTFELPQTPSYNTLAYQSLLLGMMGIMRVDAESSRGSFLGYVLIGISWWLAFMAKPTTALALGLVGLLYFLIAGKLNLRLIVVSIATATLLLLCSAWMIDGSIHAFIARLTTGLEIGRMLGEGNLMASLWRWDSFPLSGRQLYLLLLASIAMALVILLGVSGNRKFKIAGVVVAIIFTLASIAISAGGYPLETLFERYDGLQILIIPIGCLIAAILMKGIRSMSRGDFALAISLLLLPHAYAFGTGRPYWLNAQGAALFWILSGMVFLSAAKTKDVEWRIFLPVCSVAVFMVSLFVFASMEHPMRQTQPLRLDTDIVDIGQQGNQLVLSHDFAEYIQGLRQLARAGGFKANTPIIDLTGHSPGTVYALNGTPPGMSWLLGGYKGSEAFATAALNLVPCDEIAQSWIITEPFGPDKLSAHILKRYGIDLEKDYQDLGVVQTPAIPYAASQAQHLLKPRRAFEDAKDSCELKRQESSL